MRDQLEQLGGERLFRQSHGLIEASLYPLALLVVELRVELPQVVRRLDRWEKAGCFVSRSFFVADRNSASAPIGVAASAFCSVVNDLRVPNHEIETRMAAMPARKRSAAEVVRSSTVFI